MRARARGSPPPAALPLYRAHMTLSQSTHPPALDPILARVAEISTFRVLAKHFFTALCCAPCALSQEARAVTLAHAAREVDDAGAEKSS